MQEPKGAALGGTEKILEVKSAAKATGSTGEDRLSTLVLIRLPNPSLPSRGVFVSLVLPSVVMKNPENM